MLGALGATAASLAGCQGVDGTNPCREVETDADDLAVTLPAADAGRSTPTGTGGGCPPTGHLDVFLPDDVPDENPVLDAERDDVTDNRYLACALSRAHEEHDPQWLSDRDEVTHLVTISGEDLYYSYPADTLRDGATGDTYVRYRGTTYRVRYMAEVC